MNTTHIGPVASSKTPYAHTPPRSRGQCCPFCGSSEVHPSARTGLFEQIALRVKMKAPFLCYDCGHRFYDSVS